MKSRYPLIIAPVFLAMTHTAGAQEPGWNGTWSGLWEGKAPAAVSIEGSKVDTFTMQGRRRPVSDVRVEGGVLTFGVRMNGVTSTIVLRRDGAGVARADAELISPGGSRHEGSFAKLTSSAPALQDADSTGVTGSITPPPAGPPEVSR